MLTPDSCPYCDNEDELECGGDDFNGEYLFISWHCPVCDGIFDEIHKTTYEGVGMDTAFAEEVMEKAGRLEKD